MSMFIVTYDCVVIAYRAYLDPQMQQMNVNMQKGAAVNRRRRLQYPPPPAKGAWRVLDFFF